MTDVEISRRLALAIGWTKEDFYKDGDGSFVALKVSNGFGCSWRTFDYRDPAVIWPIAERFDCFPWIVATGALDPWASKLGLTTETADTAAKAVALAVIKAKESK